MALKIYQLLEEGIPGRDKLGEKQENKIKVEIKSTKYQDRSEPSMINRGFRNYPQKNYYDQGSHENQT
ncbi:hypothetical protein HMI54_012797, partial [Coelomomyces lativittatus]